MKNKPFTYVSKSKGEIEIISMSDEHLLNALRKIINGSHSNNQDLLVDATFSAMLALLADKINENVTAMDSAWMDANERDMRN